MYLAHRTKFNASIVSNAIVPGVAIAGYSVLNTGSIGGADWSYLLENSSGSWEIGYQSGAGARQIIESSGTSFGSSASGLTCTLIAPASSYVSSSVGAPPVTWGDDSVAIGKLAIAGALRTVAVGVESGIDDSVAESVSIGYNSKALHKRSNAFGANSRSAHAGESVVGGFDTSHISSIAVCTADPIAGGTFPINAVAAIDDFGYPSDTPALSSGVLGPNNPKYITYLVRVTGTIFAKGSNPNDHKVFNVEYALYDEQTTSGTITTLYSNITPLFAGSNAPAISMSLTGGQLNITVPAATVYKVAGVLRADKLAIPA